MTRAAPDLGSFAGTVRPAVLAGAALVIALAIAAAFAPAWAVRGYLVGWYFCLSAAMGAMAVLMMNHLTGGRWGWLIRRPAEAAAATLPYVALAFLPLAFGARFVFPWADPVAVAHEPLLEHRQVAFTSLAVFGRSVLFLAGWIVLGLLMRRWSLEHDRTGDQRYLERLRRLSAGGLVFYFVTMSLSSIDWIVSREVDWYSSAFGLVAITGQAVAGLCVLICTAALLRQVAVYRPLVIERASHDLGNLLLVTVVLWAYVSFFQYLVIWTGNTQDDVTWFYHRTYGFWDGVSVGLIALHFGVPFLMLLMQRNKQSIGKLACIAAGVLVMRAVDVIWMIAPSSLEHDPAPLHWTDVLGPAALFGLWWGVYGWQLRHAVLVPLARDFDPSVVHASEAAHG